MALEQLEPGAAAGRDVIDAVGEARLRDGRDGVAAADDGVPAQSATASATASVPAANGASSNAPIGPFQKTVRARGDALRVGRRASAGRCRAPSSRAGSRRTAARATSVSAENARPATTSTGSASSQPCSAQASRAPRRLGLALLVLVQRVADREAVGGRERERHGAADQDRVGARRERLEHADLVGHLDAAGDHHERPLGRVEQAAERLQLAPQQQPGRGRQQVRDALGGGVRAVRRAERVVRRRRSASARQRAPRRPGRWPSRRRGSARSRAAARRRRAARAAARSATSPTQSPQNATGAPSSSARRVAHGRAASRPGRARPSGGRGASTGSRARRARAAAAIVGSAARMRVSSVIDAVVQRDVEVDAAEHAPARDVQRIQAARERAGHRTLRDRDRRAGSRSPTRCRTRR